MIKNTPKEDLLCLSSAVLPIIYAAPELLQRLLLTFCT